MKKLDCETDNMNIKDLKEKVRLYDLYTLKIEHLEDFLNADKKYIYYIGSKERTDGVNHLQEQHIRSICSFTIEKTFVIEAAKKAVDFYKGKIKEIEIYLKNKNS